MHPIDEALPQSGGEFETDETRRENSLWRRRRDPKADLMGATRSTSDQASTADFAGTNQQVLTIGAVRCGDKD